MLPEFMMKATMVPSLTLACASLSTSAAGSDRRTRALGAADSVIGATLVAGSELEAGSSAAFAVG